MDKREAIEVFKQGRPFDDDIDWCDAWWDAYHVLMPLLERIVYCDECEHAWYRHHVPEAPYFCLIDGHFHKGDFFCRNGKPKVDET